MLKSVHEAVLQPGLMRLYYSEMENDFPERLQSGKKKAKVFARGRGGGGQRGYSEKNWVGVCGPLSKTLTLIMTKICVFPYSTYDLNKNTIPYE